MDIERIYKQYFSKVYRYVLSISKDPNVAEEITQESFFKAMKKLDNFHGNSSVQTWLFQIAKNTYFNYEKKNKSLLSIENFKNKFEDKNKSIESNFELRESSMKIHQILHKMKEPYKEVFMLRVFGELSFKEIGNVFKKTDTWARVTYHRARNIIREEIKNDCKL